MKRFFFTIITLFFCCCPVFSETGGEILSLKTEHFNLTYQIDETPYAVTVAELAEEYFRQIEAFLDFSLNESVNISIGSFKGNSAEQVLLNGLKINSGSNFSVMKERLHQSLFSIFLSEISRESGKSFLDRTDDSLFADSLCRYSIEGFSEGSHFILSDYIYNQKHNGINISEIDSLPGEIASSLYPAFFCFIETAFDREVMLRALKDKDYYGNFLNSLSAVSGKSIEIINNEFSLYLASEIPVIKTEIPGEQFLKTAGGGVIDFAISSEDNLLAALVNSGEKNLIIMINLVDGTETARIDVKTFFLLKNIFFINKGIAVTGNSEEGSFISFYDLNLKEKNREIKLPFIYINNAAPSADKNAIIINSQHGIETGLLELDFKGGNLKKIIAEKVNRFSGLACLNDSIYYSYGKDINVFTKIINESVPEYAVIRLNGEITSLNISGEIILVSVNSFNEGKVFLYNVPVQNSALIFSSEFPVHKALLKNNALYYLTSYKGDKKLLVKKLDR